MKNNIREKITNNLLYGGITKQEYREIREELLEKDRASLSVASLCLMLMFTGLFAGSLLSETMASNRIAYGVCGICFLMIHQSCRLLKKRAKPLIIPLWYVAMSVMFAYAIVLNTVIRNDISATTFCLVMVVAPLLITDKPWRVFCYFVLVACCFIPVDFHQKSNYLAFTDTVNVLCSIFMGSAIHIRIIRTKMREMTQKRYIERERDTDALTGCLTKAAFERKVVNKLDFPTSNGVLLVMDLDKFKNINDSYGHVFGDMVLRSFGECIRKSFPETALCGRFGGDEFQVWMPGKYSRKDITVCLDELSSRMKLIATPDNRMKIGVSIGIAVCPENDDKYRILFENADAALYAAKNMGRSRYVFCPDVRKSTKA